MKPLCIDLYCGLGGWAEGFLSEGWEVIGFDIVRRPYPGQLVLQDCRTIDGTRLRGRASLIVASPPCDDFARWDMPWPNVVKNRRDDPDLSLWRAAERIAREAGAPLIIENVRGAQRFTGKARCRFGKQYLWGDVYPLMPCCCTGNAAVGRKKESFTSTAKADRAKVPFELAQWAAVVYKP